ncbi:MAG: hypothetical protein ABC611_08210 [Candidatus Methanosuratincola petrocarbonis]
MSSAALGAALVCLGLLLVVLGTFGGVLGIPGLSVVDHYWGPENATVRVMQQTPGDTTVWVVHYWYGQSSEEPDTVYHTIEGSPIDVYVNSKYQTTLYTKWRAYVPYTVPQHYLASGCTVVFKYEYDPSKPYPASQATVRFDPPPQPPSDPGTNTNTNTDPNPDPYPDPTMAENTARILNAAGFCMMVAGAIFMWRRP